MKDIKHIRQDVHSVPWVMPQELGLGCAGDLGMGSNDQMPLDIFESVGIYDGRPLNVFWLKITFLVGG